MTPHILILAAGAASRMRGADKLLEPVDGAPLLTQIAQRALATGCPVTVALPPDRPLRQAALIGIPVSQVVVERPETGMAQSLKAGLRALPATAPVLLLLADLPEITTADLSHCLDVWATAPDRILRGTSALGVPGHPVGFPPDLRDALLALDGDQGARDILMAQKARILPVALPDDHATTDLDTPEEWADWRARRGA
jgi:CTP:molybdopterin cytidylyltransferase MocA